MSRKTPRFLAESLVAVFLFGQGAAIASPAADPKSKAIAVTRRLATGCRDCLFFALPTQNPLIRKHKLFVVSTLDRIPPPFWSVAVPSGGDPLVLDAAEREDWNRLMAAEKPSLRLDADVKSYVQAFLELAVGRALFVEKLLPGELERIRKRSAGATEESLQIVRRNRLLSVSFYSREPRGDLTYWDLTLQSDGTLLAAERK